MRLNQILLGQRMRRLPLTDIAAPPQRSVPITPLVEIVVDEDLTAEAAARLHSRLADALRMRPAQLVVDLSGCGYADALAIDILLNAHRRAYQTGGRLTLRSPSPRVERLLHLARVHQVFHVVTLAS
jgi:anti-anti-sigma factor